jgi:hypothetical protein
MYYYSIYYDLWHDKWDTFFILIIKNKKMKTKNIQISLLAIFAFISLNVSAVSLEINKDKKAIAFISPASDMNETTNYFESWMIELKEFNNNTIIFPDEEIQIETWMTIEFSTTSENKNFLDQDLNLEDWMINSFNFNKDEKSFDIEPEIEPWMCQIM